VRILLDTHILLWSLDAPEKLPENTRALIASPASEVFFSAASIWEIAIKTALGKLNFPYSPFEIAEAARKTGFFELSVACDHAAGVAKLPMHHNDPFDRLLISQALALPARLITADTTLPAYSELVELAR
jgi:PIN domain nuclease of toxin-antitoxin system